MSKQETSLLFPMYSTTLLNVAVAESKTALASLNDLSNCLKKKNQLKHRLCTDGLAQSRDVQAPLHGTALLGGTMVGLRGETVHDNHDKHPADQMRCTAAAGRSIVMDLQNICCSYLFQYHQ